MPDFKRKAALLSQMASSAFSRRYIELCMRRRPEHFLPQKLHLRKPYDRVNSCRDVYRELDAGKRLTRASLLAGTAGEAQTALVDATVDAINTLIFDRADPSEHIAKADALIAAHGADFSTSFVVNLKRIMMAGGLFELSYRLEKARQKALLDRYKDGGKVDPRDLTGLLWAYLSEGMDDEARALLSRTPRLTRRVMGRPLRFFLYIVGLTTREAAQAEIEHMCWLADEQTRGFADYIRGKRVAILGPAPYALNADEVKNDFDVNCRMNFYGEQQLPEDKRALKTDIVYMNVALGSSIVKKDESMRYLSGVDYLILKSTSVDLREKAAKYTTTRYRFSPPFVFTEAGAVANMAQASLYDLFHFDVEKVKLFNVNFYLSKDRYEKTYESVAPQTKLYLWYTFGLHYMTTLWLFTKRMYEHGRIEADDECADVLRLSEAEFVHQMQEMEWKQVLQAKEAAQ